MQISVEIKPDKLTVILDQQPFDPSKVPELKLDALEQV
jgi:hypothetical protein